jgi:hypothetical protein
MKELDELMLKVYSLRPHKVSHYKAVPRIVEVMIKMVAYDLNVKKLRIAAKYHDVGRVQYPETINPFHQYATFLVLKGHGMEEIGDLAMRHDCFGWTPKETRRAGFNKEFETEKPIDLTPNSVEAKVLALADGLRPWANSREDLWNPKLLIQRTMKAYSVIGQPKIYLNRKKKIVEELESYGLDTNKAIAKAKVFYEQFNSCL